MNNKSSIRIYNKTLNPLFWDEKTNDLDPKIRLILLKIATDFYKWTDLQYPIVDIFFIGSSANYNWTPESDIDVHVVVDVSENFDPKFIRKIMDSLGQLWNEHRKVIIKGHQVEIYLQDKTEPNGSPETFKKNVPIYSLVSGEWIVKPVFKKIHIDKEKVKTIYREYRDKINKAIKKGDYSELKQLMSQIREYRKKEIISSGDFSVGNLVFKGLRHTGYLKKLKDAINSSYIKSMSIDEMVYNDKPFIITGRTTSDLDVIGEKYREGEQMITHRMLSSKYGITGIKVEDWRYRSDINFLFWWGFPTDDIREATKDWLRRKYNIVNPKEILAGDATDYIKSLIHHPFIRPKRRLTLENKFDSNNFYVVGIISGDLNIVSKRYTSLENYITHDQLRKRYNLQIEDNSKLWRYHSVGNWIFWWERPSFEQREKVVNFLMKKYNITNLPTNEYPDTIRQKNKILEKNENVKNKKPFLVVGLVNSEYSVYGKADYGDPKDEKRKYTITHSEVDEVLSKMGWNYRIPYSHWRYKSLNNTIYWWPDDIINEDLIDTVKHYLNKTWGVRNPKIEKSKYKYFDEAHFVL